MLISFCLCSSYPKFLLLQCFASLSSFSFDPFFFFACTFHVLLFFSSRFLWSISILLAFRHSLISSSHLFRGLPTGLFVLTPFSYFTCPTLLGERCNSQCHSPLHPSVSLFPASIFVFIMCSSASFVFLLMFSIQSSSSISPLSISSSVSSWKETSLSWSQFELCFEPSSVSSSMTQCNSSSFGMEFPRWQPHFSHLNKICFDVIWTNALFRDSFELLARMYSGFQYSENGVRTANSWMAEHSASTYLSDLPMAPLISTVQLFRLLIFTDLPQGVSPYNVGGDRNRVFSMSFAATPRRRKLSTKTFIFRNLHTTPLTKMYRVDFRFRLCCSSPIWQQTSTKILPKTKKRFEMTRLHFLNILSLPTTEKNIR